MKIASINLTPLALRFKEPYHWAGRVDLGAAVILVEITAEDGTRGYGESTAPLPATGSLDRLRLLTSDWVGREVGNIEPLVARARMVAGRIRTPRESALLTAGADMALWDLYGKLLNQPVHRLLGGACHDEVDYFAFPQGDSAAELASAARGAAEADYQVIYIKVGRGEAADVANTAAVREVIGDRRLRLDANCAWDPVEAVRMCRLLARFDPEFIEQPTPPHAPGALARVRAGVDVPLAADQSVFTMEEVYGLCRDGSADLLVFSPHETGGLTMFKKTAAIAEAAGLKVCLHGQFTSGISDCAQHQAALNTPNISTGNQIMHQLLVEDLITSPDITPKEGKLGVWEMPGLGFEINPDAVARAAGDYISHGHELSVRPGG